MDAHIYDDNHEVTPICPKCKMGYTRRVRRSFWMRLFPNHILVKCYYCRGRSIVMPSASESTERREPLLDG